MVLRRPPGCDRQAGERSKSDKRCATALSTKDSNLVRLYVDDRWPSRTALLFKETSHFEVPGDGYHHFCECFSTQVLTSLLTYLSF